jgi:hypothetical protein
VSPITGVRAGMSGELASATADQPTAAEQIEALEQAAAVPGADVTAAPAADVRGGNILLAWKGAPGDSQIWLSLFDGKEFSGQWPLLDAGTSVGPAAMDADGITLLAWKGKAGGDTIYWKHV